MLCLLPQWLPVLYSLQTIIFLPMRYYTYKKKAWHYFLFDLCYYVNVLCVLFIWVFPSSVLLWQACYLLTHGRLALRSVGNVADRCCARLGSLASAVITWRNSLVFHDWDKVVSLYIHIYPPLVFTAIRFVILASGTSFNADGHPLQTLVS